MDQQLITNGGLRQCRNAETVLVIFDIAYWEATVVHLSTFQNITLGSDVRSMVSFSFHPHR